MEFKNKIKKELLVMKNKYKPKNWRKDQVLFSKCPNKSKVLARDKAIVISENEMIANYLEYISN
jgi:hypothetical protein